MDKVTHYRQIIKNIKLRYLSRSFSNASTVNSYF